MLTRLIVVSYDVLIELSLWLFIISGMVIGGYTYGFIGVLLGLIACFIFAVVFFGAFLLLSDIRNSVYAIEMKYVGISASQDNEDLKQSTGDFEKAGEEKKALMKSYNIKYSPFKNKYVCNKQAFSTFDDAVNYAKNMM